MCPSIPPDFSNQPEHALIVKSLPIILPDAPPLEQILPISRNQDLHPSVWLLVFSNGFKAIVKQQIFASFTRGKPYDLLVVEKEICDLLSDYALPHIYGFVEDHGLVYMEWCGESTLDDRLQSAPPSESRIQTQKVVEAFSEICEGLKTHTRRLSKRSFPGCGVRDARTDWRGLKGRIRLDRIAAHYELKIDESDLSIYRSLLDLLLDSMGNAHLHLGPTDYNARNVILNSGSQTVCFIEFSKLGWDWPERRLIQYTSGLGARQEGGTFRNALDAEICVEYGQMAAGWQEEVPSTISGRLDAHHFVFHLLAADRLIQAYSSDTDPGLLEVWSEPVLRLENLRKLLATKLSDNQDVCEFRSWFSEVG